MGRFSEGLQVDFGAAPPPPVQVEFGRLPDHNKRWLYLSDHTLQADPLHHLFQHGGADRHPAGQLAAVDCPSGVHHCCQCPLHVGCSPAIEVSVDPRSAERVVCPDRAWRNANRITVGVEQDGRPWPRSIHDADHGAVAVDAHLIEMQTPHLRCNSFHDFQFFAAQTWDADQILGERNQLFFVDISRHLFSLIR